MGSLGLGALLLVDIDSLLLHHYLPQSNTQLVAASFIGFSYLPVLDSHKFVHSVDGRLSYRPIRRRFDPIIPIDLTECLMSSPSWFRGSCAIITRVDTRLLDPDVAKPSNPNFYSRRGYNVRTS